MRVRRADWSELDRIQCAGCGAIVLRSRLYLHHCKRPFTLEKEVGQ